jgi:hypothetical protein
MDTFQQYRDIDDSDCDSDSDYNYDSDGPDLFEPEETPPARKAKGVTWAAQNMEELRATAYISSSRSTLEHKQDLKEIWERYEQPYKRWCPRDTPLHLYPPRTTTPPPSEITDAQPPLPPSKPHVRQTRHTIGARIQALTLWVVAEWPQWKVTAATGVSRSTLSKLRIKALSRGWTSKEKGEASILEEWHIDDKPCTGRPKISLALHNFIITTMTKNSTTRQWSYCL